MMCERMPDMEIRHEPQGYYSLYVDGIFEGNYDNQMEAVLAADALMHPREAAETA